MTCFVLYSNSDWTLIRQVSDMKPIIGAVLGMAVIGAISMPALATGPKAPGYSPATSPVVQRNLLRIRQEQIRQAQRAAAEKARAEAARARKSSKN